MARILVVDDDTDIVDCIVQALSAVGHVCVVEREGARAWERVQRGEADLLILDVMLPGLSGFEVCRRVRANPKLYTIPVLFLSAMDADEEVRHGLAQGADDYLTKPFSIDMLLSRVVNLLASSAQSPLVDELTSLPGPKRIKLEVQKTINERRPFSIVYCELLKLTDFARAAGAENRARAMRHFARGLKITADEIAPNRNLAGHMGSGHFVVLLPVDKAEDFCERVKKNWEDHLPKLYTDAGQSKALDPNAKPDADRTLAPILETLLCATAYPGGNTVTAKSLFDTLSHLRQGAINARIGGIHVDRRH